MRLDEDIRCRLEGWGMGHTAGRALVTALCFPPPLKISSGAWLPPGAGLSAPLDVIQRNTLLNSAHLQRLTNLQPPQKGIPPHLIHLFHSSGPRLSLGTSIRLVLSS